jgi:glutathione synthase
MRLAFVVADARVQNPTYATVYLAQAAARRGHEVGFVGVDDLTLTADNQVSGTVVRPPLGGATNQDLCAALASAAVPVHEELLGSYDVVFLRYHPHRDGAPAGNPAIDFGWRLRLGGVLVVNDPEGSQRAGGRMYLSGLPAEIRPRTLITRDVARVKAFLKSLDAPAVIKPLAESEGSAENRFYVARGQVKNLNQMITVIRKTGYLVVQEYLPDAAQGEKRLLLLGGEPIRVGDRVAIYRRLLDEGVGLAPHRNGDGAGSRGVRKRCEFGAAEQRIVDLLRPKLVSDGLYFVGVDLCGDKVLEVNVFTPGGAHSNRELYDLDVAEVVVRDLERRVVVRQAYRKTLERVA